MEADDPPPRLLDLPREHAMPTIVEAPPPTPPPPPFEARKLESDDGSGPEDCEDGSTAHRHSVKYRRHVHNTAPQILSSLYAKLLVTTVVVLVLTELLPNRISLFHYHGYLFCYIIGGGIMFLFLVYLGMATNSCCKSGSELDSCSGTVRAPDSSIYMRTAVLLLGLGGLIAAGLEIGVMFTMGRSCADKMLHKIQPVLLAVFTFLQMHVLFLDSRRVVTSLGCFKSVALMHLAAANVAVWVRLVAWTTARSWLGASHLTFNSTLSWPPSTFNHTVHSIDQDGQHRVHFTSNCRWTDYSGGKEANDYLAYHMCLKNSTLGVIWDQALPYLTPFVVQYCLGSAALLYTLWVGPTHRAVRLLDRRYSPSRSGTLERKSLQSQQTIKPKSKIDCRGSTKGLFLGILVLVVGSIVMILFFVLRGNDRLQQDMLFIVKTLHCTVLGVSALAILIGLLQVQQMCSTSHDQLPPHQMLQPYGIISLMAFGAFTIVASITNVRAKSHLVTLVDASLLIFQGCMQSLLINRLAFKSCPSGCEHQKYRPGRQVVAFLIFTNFVLWIMETFTSQNHVTSQIQLEFFGKVPWDFITTLTLPIIVLYRIHSAVLFTEAWKHAYHT